MADIVPRRESRSELEFMWRHPMARLILRAMVMMAIATAAIAYAQTSPAFEVSPPSPLKPGRISQARVTRTPQRLAFHASPVGNIVAFAYGLPLDRVERRPQFMYDSLYDVAVTTAADTSLPEQRRMLQKLLEERFSLAVHRISYASPVYYLVAGPNVHLTPAQETDAEGLPGLGRHMSMSDLADWLYSQLQLPVLDKTGITGLFEIQISGIPPRGGAEATIRAVQNSLGLILERHQGTAESLIVDRAEKPN